MPIRDNFERIVRKQDKRTSVKSVMMKRILRLLLVFSQCRELSSVSSDDLNSRNTEYKSTIRWNTHRFFLGFRLLLYRCLRPHQGKCVIITQILLKTKKTKPFKVNRNFETTRNSKQFNSYTSSAL